MPLRRRVYLLSLILLVLGLTAEGQSHAEPEATTNFGSVSGHIFYAGSNTPARFVSIALQPAKIEIPKAPVQAGSASSFRVYQSALDGSYFIPHVAAGAYYVVVMRRGVLSPFAMFTDDQLVHPSAAVQQRMASTLPTVHVRPSATANLDVFLQRGASLSGTVRFDDGTPFPEATVSVTRRAEDGKWRPLRVADSNASTDSEGHWTIGGLPPGEYRISVQLMIQNESRSSLLVGGDSVSMFGYSLFVWLGDTTRERDAKTVTLSENQTAQGQDITIPISKIHRVTGAIIDQETGQALNAGDVKLVYADDGQELGSTAVDPETGTFTLPFVPEGEYKLRSQNPRLSRFEAVQNPETDPFGMQRKESVVRRYASGETPLLVQGDVNAANLAVHARIARVGAP